MKAARYLGPNSMEVAEASMPVLSEGQALVKVHCAGVCGTDLAIAAGAHPRAKPPLIPGHEFVGEVVDVRPAQGGDNRVSVGDRVTAYPLISCGKCWPCLNGHPHVCRDLRIMGIDKDGCMCQYTALDIDSLYTVPPDLPDEKAVLVEPLAVGVHAATDIAEGEPAVVIGAGPVGLALALALRAGGAGRIIVSDVSEYRVEVSRGLGFEGVDVRKDDLLGIVMDITDGNGTGLVFEAAGSPESIKTAFEIVRPKARIVLVSSHKKPREVDLRTVVFKEIAVIGTRVYTRSDFARAVEIAGSLPLEKLISNALPIDDTTEAFQLAGSPDKACKVVIDMGYNQ